MSKMTNDKKISASASISELMSKDDITNVYKAQSNEKKAIVFLMNKLSHVSFLTKIIDFVKLEPSNWNFSKLAEISKTKHKRKISRIEFTEHLIRVCAHLEENFVLISKEEYETLLKNQKKARKRKSSKKKESDKK